MERMEPAERVEAARRRKDAWARRVAAVAAAISNSASLFDASVGRVVYRRRRIRRWSVANRSRKM